MDNPLDNPAISPPYRTGTLQSFQSNDTERELELNRNQHEQAKEELSNIIGRFTRTAVCGRPFILVGELTRHLQSSESPSLSEPDATSPRWTSDFDRLWKSSIFRKTGGAPDLNAEKLRRSTALFFILLQLDYPELTAEFLHYGLDDSMLPLDRETLTRKMRGTIEGYLRTPDPVPKVPKCWDEFVDMFLKEQQAWCPAKLELNFGSRNVGTQILPFYEKFPISSIQKDPKPSAHGASVCMIEVPEDFVGDKLKKELSGAKYEVSTRSRDLRDIEEGKREIVYRFALKQFPPEKNEAFEEERIALEALRKLSGMVGYIGWYECIDISPPEMLAPAAIPPSANTHPSHCILLELGDYDFNEAMIEEAPPDLPGEIKTFWKELLGISDALVAIHKFDIDGTTYHGWHGDIKPENILVVRGTYKLADPGEARIKRETTVDKRSRPPRAAVMGGTRTYAAPEKASYLDANDHVDIKTKILQTSDVWSLGCTLSVAATYLVLGTQGVNLYKSIRIKASKNGDAFHDGTVVLQIVTKWHRYLRASRRHADVFTHAILDVVDEDMLIPEKERKSAETVANRFREILENTPIPDEDFSDVQAFLQEIDKEEELRKERLASLPPQSTNLPIENQPQPPTITVIGESKEQTSEEKLRSQPLQLTAKRQPIRRLSARQTDLRIRPIRKIFSDPVSRVIWTDEGRRTKAKLGLDTTTSLQDLPHGHGISLASLPPQNIFQLNEQLSTIGLEWNLPWKTAGSGAGIRGGMKRMMKKQQVPVKGKMKDDPLELLFRGRDIVFLVDNGWTMSSHWHEACEVFKVLSWRLLGYDEDGMELYFTDPATTIAVLPSPDETSHVLQQAMKMAAPSSQRAHGTDIIPKLAELMNKYAIDQCRDGPQNARKRTIYVLTDGIWEHSTTESVDDFFRYQLKRLQDTYHPPGVPGPLSVDQIRKALKTTRPLTIQFIQFGSDPAATERLRHLDEDFVSGGYIDIMDREPSGGDVNKMIAGSINEGMDWKMSGATLPQTSFVSSEGRSTEQPYSGETSRHVSASASTGFHRRSYPPSDHGNSRQSYTNSGSTSIGQPSDGHARSRSSVESSYPHSTSSAVSPPFLRDPFSGATSTHTPQDQLGRELDLTPKEGNRD